jgi:hypothetical protein
MPLGKAWEGDDGSGGAFLSWIRNVVVVDLLMGVPLDVFAVCPRQHNDVASSTIEGSP